MKKYLVLSALAVAFAASPVLAGDHGDDDGHKHKKGGHHGKMMDKMFEKDDLDGDGAISKEEFDKAGTARFDAMDGDKDGKVTKDEAKAHMEAKRAEWKKMKEEKAKATSDDDKGTDDDGPGDDDDGKTDD